MNAPGWLKHRCRPVDRLLSWLKHDHALVEWSTRAMGGTINIRFPRDQDARLDQATERVYRMLMMLENDLSAYIPGSLVRAIGRLSEGESLAVPPHVEQILTRAQALCERTHGAFDVTIAPLVDLWGFGRTAPPSASPSAEVIATARAKVGGPRLQIGAGTVRALADQPQIDFGAIGKGFAVDLAFEECRATGVARFLIDFGSTVRVAGCAMRTTPWTLAVRDPFSPTQVLGSLPFRDGQAVATSGGYEFSIEFDGVREPHIIDPRTGRPARGLAAVTVIADDATEADALSTAFFVLGLEASLRVLERCPHVEALFVPDGQPTSIYLTAGLAQVFEPKPGLRGGVRQLPA